MKFLNFIYYKSNLIEWKLMSERIEWINLNEINAGWPALSAIKEILEFLYGGKVLRLRKANWLNGVMKERNEINAARCKQRMAEHPSTLSSINHQSKTFDWWVVDWKIVDGVAELLFQRQRCWFVFQFAFTLFNQISFQTYFYNKFHFMKLNFTFSYQSTIFNSIPIKWNQNQTFLICDWI